VRALLLLICVSVALYVAVAPPVLRQPAGIFRFVNAPPALRRPAAIFRFVEGRDRGPAPLKDAELAELVDPFATLILRRSGTPPATMKDLIGAVNNYNDRQSGLPEQLSFFVSETGTIQESRDTTNLRRSFRMVLTRAPLQRPKEPTLFISAPAGTRPGVIEVAAWDASKNAFNFYRRPDEVHAVWHYKGDSRDAFTAPTAERGCFACHRHGMPLMKELDGPWANWHTQSSQIPREAIPDADIRDSDWFRQKTEGEILETIVKAQIRRAAVAEVGRVASAGVVTERVLRPLFQSSTANLASSPQQSNIQLPVRLPRTFFFDVRTLSALKVTIPTFRPIVPFDRYKRVVRDQFKARLADELFERPGDTFFAFVVPEKAFEETALIEQLVERGVVSRHFAVCALAVDFPNPILSARRDALMKYVPTTAVADQGAFTVSETIASAIEAGAAGKPASSPEHQFLALWTLPEDQARVALAARLAAYATAVEERLKMDDGFADVFRVASTRRDWFLGHPLAESRLLFPASSVTGTRPVRMNEDASVSFE